MSFSTPDDPSWDTYRSISQHAWHQDRADQMADLDAQDEARR